VALSYGGRAGIGGGNAHDRGEKLRPRRSCIDAITRAVVPVTFTGRSPRSRFLHDRTIASSASAFFASGSAPTPNLVFTKTLWPDFGAAISNGHRRYSCRERRYGASVGSR